MNAAIDAGSGLTRSQSEGGLSLSGLVDPVGSGQSTIAAGKRRRVETDDDNDDDAPPPFSDLSVEPVQSSPALKAGPRAAVRSSTSSDLKALSRPSAPVATPAKPSPLWQVSHADTPSPSPPKKTQPDGIARPPTRAADLMMDIIREEDAARPVSLSLQGGSGLRSRY